MTRFLPTIAIVLIGLASGGDSRRIRVRLPEEIQTDDILTVAEQPQFSHFLEEQQQQQPQNRQNEDEIVNYSVDDDVDDSVDDGEDSNEESDETGRETATGAMEEDEPLTDDDDSIEPTQKIILIKGENANGVEGGGAGGLLLVPQSFLQTAVFGNSGNLNDDDNNVAQARGQQVNRIYIRRKRKNPRGNIKRQPQRIIIIRGGDQRGHHQQFRPSHVQQWPNHIGRPNNNNIRVITLPANGGGQQFF